MSWTSEHERPSAPEHPDANAPGDTSPASTADTIGDGDQLDDGGERGPEPSIGDGDDDPIEGADHRGADERDDADAGSDAAGGNEHRDTGDPLDPSAFDGLFDDLDDDNPLDEFLKAPLAEPVEAATDDDADGIDPVDLDDLLADAGTDDLIVVDADETEPADDADPTAMEFDLDELGVEPESEHRMQLGDDLLSAPPAVEDEPADPDHPVGLEAPEPPTLDGPSVAIGPSADDPGRGDAIPDEPPEPALAEWPSPDPLGPTDDGPTIGRRVGSSEFDRRIGPQSDRSDDGSQPQQDHGRATGRDGWGHRPDHRSPLTDGGPFRPNRPPSDPTPLSDGPIRASPPIQHDPEPSELPLTAVALEETAPIEAPAPARQRQRQRQRQRIAPMALAVVLGGLVGIGGAVLLAALAGGDDGVDQAAAPLDAATDLVGDPDDPANPGTTSDGADRDLSAIRGTELTSLRLAATGDQTAAVVSSPTLELLTQLIDAQPDQPITATVRTYTEATAAADLARSSGEAESLAAQLVDLGADPELVSVVGVGRSLLNPAQPVPNFVVPSAGLDPSPLATIASDIGPFAIGLDRATGRLRPESLAAIDRLAQAMAADDARRLTLAAYSFDEASAEANDAAAEAAAAAATLRLTDLGIDPSRIEIIVAGDDPYAPPDRVGHHVDLRWGEPAQVELAMRATGFDEIDFAEGSSEPGPEVVAIVERMAAVLVETGADAVIDVQSFDGLGTEAEIDLSVSRAQAIGELLLAGGVAADQFRLHGGSTPQFRVEGRNGRVLVTLIEPPADS